MADPLTPEEMAAQMDQKAEAQRIANAYLAGPNASVAPPAASFPGDVASGPPPVEPIPNAAGPAPVEPASGTWDAAKKGLLRGLGNAALGPAGAVLGAVQTYGDTSGNRDVKPKPSPDLPPAGPEQAKKPLEPTEAPPVFLPSFTGGVAPKLVMPAGMRPESDSVSVQQGIAVPERTKTDMEAAQGHALDSIDRASEADKVYQQSVADMTAQKLQAEDDARLAHAKVQADRKAATDQAMANIRQLNDQASADIDPDKFWHDRGALAQILGSISVAIAQFGAGLTGTSNSAQAIIENGINREIEAQRFNKQNKKAAADQAANLYQMNLKALGDEDSAIDATKASLFQNVAIQLDKEAARRGVAMTDATLAERKAALLEKSGEFWNKVALQEEDKITKQSTRKFHDAVYSGGAAGGGPSKLPDNVIEIPASDQTGNKAVYVSVNEKDYARLSAMQGATAAIVTLNNEAMALRKRLREVTDPAYVVANKGKAVQEAMTIRLELQSKQDQRIKAQEKAAGEGVTRDSDFKRAMETGVDYTAGFGGRSTKLSGDVEKLIQNSSNTLQAITDANIRGATGQVVQHAVARDKNGYIQNQWLPTGQLYGSRAVAPEKK